MLDQLLRKLHGEGHRVLIFSLFTKMLDLLEDYCQAAGPFWYHARPCATCVRSPGWRYVRLDGATNRVRRGIDMRRFNAKDSPFFIYLIRCDLTSHSMPSIPKFEAHLCCWL